MISKHSSILLHSILLVGALLPLAFPVTLPSATQSFAQPTSTANGAELVAFGRGIPASRGGGGTR